MNEEILNKIAALFKNKLEEKNSWGKNEVFRAYSECVIKVLAQHIDKHQTVNK